MNARENRAHIIDQILPDQLCARQINGHKQIKFGELFLPCIQISCRTLNGEQSKLHDETRAFGNRNKFGRRNSATARMLPAHQCFKARNGAIIKPDNRLIDQTDFIALKGTAQIGFQL
ncbi:hypothetical protein FQZ97_1212230 [compost metagenome]